MSVDIKEVLPLLNRGDAMDDQWPDRKGEYWALCPFHNDRHVGSFSVNKNGFYCFACSASGNLDGLFATLAGYKHSGAPGVDPKEYTKRKKLKPRPAITGDPVTLEEYARIKQLPVPFLSGLGMANGEVWVRKEGGGWKLRPAVAMPYFGRDGTLLRSRFRVTMTGPKHERFRWGKGTGFYPYGLWRLPASGQSIMIVEGESDAQTLWFHGVNALGLPGTGTWRPEWADYLDRLRVFVWQEPDEAGQKLAETLAYLKPTMVCHPMYKDVSEYHIKHGELPWSARLARTVESAWKKK